MLNEIRGNIGKKQFEVYQLKQELLELREIGQQYQKDLDFSNRVIAYCKWRKRERIYQVAVASLGLLLFATGNIIAGISYEIIFFLLERLNFLKMSQEYHDVIPFIQEQLMHNGKRQFLENMKSKKEYQEQLYHDVVLKNESLVTQYDNSLSDYQKHVNDYQKELERDCKRQYLEAMEQFLIQVNDLRNVSDVHFGSNNEIKGYPFAMYNGEMVPASDAPVLRLNP